MTRATERVLFTTFTRNLALDISQQLNGLCPREHRGRIEVVHLDQWVRELLTHLGVRGTVVYGDHEGREALWKRALSMAPVVERITPEFLRDEFEQVVLAQGVVDQAGYLAATRTGRGVALTRRERAQIWPVFEDYRAGLAREGWFEVADAMREARMRLAARPDWLPYRSVVVDEAQDLGEQALMLLRQVVPVGETGNDLFIVGDAHQRIYGHPVVLSKCGVQVRGRSRTLRINYRTTEEIRRWAVSLLVGQPVDDLDGGADDGRGYRSLMHGEAPVERRFASFDEDFEAIVAWLKELAGVATEGEAPEVVWKRACVVARSKWLVGRYVEAFEARGVKCFALDRQGDEARVPGVRVATMHRVKGLEFDWVWLAGVNEGVVPPQGVVRGVRDAQAQAEAWLKERSLVHVAATRARRELVVSCHGRPSVLLGE